MPTSTTNGCTIHFQERGAGLPLVLVHGFPLDGRIYDDQFAALSKRCRVIVPDLPGFGRSSAARAFTMQSLADDLRAFLAAIGALPCVFAGLSMGGYVALPFARTYARDLKGLMLIDTRSEPDLAEAKIGRDRMIEAARARGAGAVAEMMFPKMLAESTVHQRPPIAARLRQIMESQPVDAICHALTAIRDREDFTPFLPQIQVPTLVLVGAYDVITPPAGAEKMHAAIPRSWLTTIEGSGHLPVMENPAQVNEEMGKLLDEIT